jgi:putative FmdB family regulatory protein
MPIYPHKCKECGHEWTEVYSVSSPIPDTCPSCRAVGSVKRVISKDQGVTVNLSAKEFKDVLPDLRKKIERDVAKNENLQANIMGETAYHNTQTNIENIDRDLDHKS